MVLDGSRITSKIKTELGPYVRVKSNLAASCMDIINSKVYCGDERRPSSLSGDQRGIDSSGSDARVK